MTRRVLPKSDIILNTNGILLQKMPEEFWTSCFQNRIYIRMTKYPLKLNIKAISKIAKSHGVTFSAHSINSFLKYQMNLHGDSNPRETYNHCRKFYICNFLLEGRIYPCPTVACSPVFAKCFNLELPLSDKDSIDIHADITGKDILNFIDKPIPWCRFCTTTWPASKWEKSRCKIDEWV